MNSPEPWLPWFARLPLWISDLLRTPIEALGIDHRQFRAILGLRFLLDSRKPTGTSTIALGGLAVTCAMLLLMGGLVAFVMRVAGDAFWGEVLAQTVTMAFLALGLVMEFGALLFDPSDATLVLPAPVSDRTLLAARIAHAAYLFALQLACLSAAPLLMGAYLFEPLTWLVAHALASLLAGASSLVFVVLLYFAALRTVGVGRFRGALSWVQIGAMTLFYGVQFTAMPLIRSLAEAGFFEQRSPWLALFPPAWFGGWMEVWTGARGPVVMLLAALAVLGPPVGLVLALRLARSRYLLALASISAGGSRSSRPTRPGLGDRIATRMTRRGPERAGFQLAWILARRELGFRLRVWPMALVFVAMWTSFALNEETMRAAWWSNSIYATLPMLVLALEQSKFGDSPDARWLLSTAPAPDRTGIAHGSRKALITLCVVAPAAGIVLAITVLYGAAGLAHGVLAFEIALAAALLLAPIVRVTEPFSVAFRQTLAGASIGIYLGTVALGFGLAGIQALLSWSWVSMTLGIAGIAAWLLFRAHRSGALGPRREAVGSAAARL